MSAVPANRRVWPLDEHIAIACQQGVIKRHRSAWLSGPLTASLHRVAPKCLVSRQTGEVNPHVLMENRNGLLVQTFLTEATGRAERDAAMLMAEAIPPGKRVTLGGDKNYDTQELVRELRGMNITPHVAQNDTNRSSAVDERTTRHAGYEVSQRKLKTSGAVVRVDEDGRDAKESEVARDRQGWLAVYLHRGCL